MAVEPLSRADEMNAFYAEINPKGLDALWRHQGVPGADGPRAPFAPYLWRWSMVRPYMQRTAELVRPGADAERRVLTLNNPTAQPMQSTTHTISAAVQLVLPGERAPSHRHTMAAIRWVLEGDGAMTFVDGEPCSMHPGDLILTPAWCWHGHLNETSSPMLWMDSLDVPLVRTLRAALYEEYPGDFQETTRQTDESLSRYGAGHLRPTWDRGAKPVSPLLSFPWTQTERLDGWSRPADHRLLGADAAAGNPYAGAPPQHGGRLPGVPRPRLDDRRRRADRLAAGRLPRAAAVGLARAREWLAERGGGPLLDERHPPLRGDQPVP
jgi:gentisate 1,2-dioxygenase